MGSVNPVCVFPHALRLHGPESLARDYVTSLLLGDGQFCTCPGIVAVPDSADGQAFFDSARQALADYLGATLLTDAIAASYRRGVARLLEHARGATASSSEDAGARVPGYLIELAVDDVIGHPALREEVFGPAGVLVRCEPERFIELVRAVGGSLTVTIHATEQDEAAGALAAEATRLAGRVVWNGWPTGVAVTRAMHHGGPWPATSSPAHTSVGVLGIRRFQRPVVFQETPDHVLPVALRDANPLHIPRCVDGIWTTAALTGREA
jgi:NADP-dependent aldehyde dehydrogenase